MADELDGVIAFENILERLIESEAARRSQTFEVSDLRQQLATARNEREGFRFERDNLQKAHDRDMPKLGALWRAADAFLGTLTLQLRTDATADVSQAMATLRSALDAAHDACNQIPF